MMSLSEILAVNEAYAKSQREKKVTKLRQSHIRAAGYGLPVAIHPPVIHGEWEARRK